MGIQVHGWMGPLEIVAYGATSGALAAGQLLIPWMAFGERARFDAMPLRY
jgi:hypothetical protein